LSEYKLLYLYSKPPSLFTLLGRAKELELKEMIGSNIGKANEMTQGTNHQGHQQAQDGIGVGRQLKLTKWI
jgi:hypothetical protein